MLYKMTPDSYLLERIEIPDIYQIFSVTADSGLLLINTNNGLYKYIGTSWELIFENTSPTDFREIVTAIHTGYLPYKIFKDVNTIVSIFLLIIVLTGVVIFLKKIGFFIDKKRWLNENDT